MRLTLFIRGPEAVAGGLGLQQGFNVATAQGGPGVIGHVSCHTAAADETATCLQHRVALAAYTCRLLRLNRQHAIEKASGSTHNCTVQHMRLLHTQKLVPETDLYPSKIPNIHPWPCLTALTVSLAMYGRKKGGCTATEHTSILQSRKPWPWHPMT